MGKIRVEMKASTRTGRKRVVVYYESDPDLTYQEHLKRHHAIIEQLLSLNVIRQEDIGQVEFRVLEPETIEMEIQAAPPEEREEKKEKA
jgi:hypothetical protein